MIACYPSSFTPTHTFYCDGCGIGGDVIRFLMEIEQLRFPEVLEILAQYPTTP